MAAKGIREIAVIGICEPVRRRRVVEAISNRTTHSLVLDPDLEGLDPWGDSQGSPIQRSQVHGNRAAVLRSEICTGCGRCLRVCPSEAIRRIEGRISIDPAQCSACGKCVESCSRGAISIEEPLLAWFLVSTSSHGRLVHGRVVDGQRATTDLVLRLRDRARREAKLYGMENLVVDIPWNSGPIFELLTEPCDERILVVDDSSTSVAAASRMLGLTPSGNGISRLAIETEGDEGFRFLSDGEIEECIQLAGSGVQVRS